MGRLSTRQARERERRDELLSAYLDGELSAGERARLEAQLASDPALQAELEVLHHTVALVRDLPPVPIPRNFILPRTMAVGRPLPETGRERARRRTWVAPLLTAATAVVSLVFVVVLASDLLLFGMGRMAFAPAAEPPLEAEAPQAALAPTLAVEEVVVEKEVPADTPPPMPVEAPPEEAPGATDEAERYAVEAPADANATALAAEAAPTEEPVAPAPAASPPTAEKVVVAPTSPAPTEAAEPTGPEIGGGGLAEEPAVPSPTAVLRVTEAPAALEPSATPPTAAGATPSPLAPTAAVSVPEQKDEGSVEPAPSGVGEVAPPAIEREGPEAAEVARGVPEREVAERAGIPPWRMLEVILGLAVPGLALATVWAWRARRR